MSTNIEGAPAPKSESEQALAELEKEGQFAEGKQPPEEKKEETPVPPKEEKKEEVPPEKVEEPKPDRSPRMVEAWKLNVAEDQKAKLEKDLNDLKSKVEELSKQKAPVTQAQQDDIAEEIKAIAKDKDVDVEFLTKFADSILKKAEGKYKPSVDVEKTLNDLKAQSELAQELNMYSQEFEKDVLPLVKDLGLTDAALSDLKSSLKDLAFSETYAKVPLKEIFQIKQDALGIKAPKKSSEGNKSVKTRASDVVDLENLTEEEFSKLPPEAIEKIAETNRGGWKSGQ